MTGGRSVLENVILHGGRDRVNTVSTKVRVEDGELNVRVVHLGRGRGMRGEEGGKEGEKGG